MAEHKVPAPQARRESNDLKDPLPMENNTPSTMMLAGTSESRPIQSRCNIVLFGEMGVGKSSVVNLIMGKDVAKSSAGSSSCTLDCKPYDVTIRGRDFRIFDTVGLNEPQEFRNSDSLVGAIYKAYRLISYLSETGGVNLLLFCMRKGRITVNMQQNYQLFYDFLCHKKVPVALVVTHLEHEEKMEDWWLANQSHFVDIGIHTVGQACITAKRDFGERYNASRQIVHDLLIAHGCGIGFTHERESRMTELRRTLLHFAGIPRWNNVKVRARTFRSYGLNEREIDVLLKKISAVDEDMSFFKVRPSLSSSSRRSYRLAI